MLSELFRKVSHKVLVVTSERRQSETFSPMPEVSHSVKLHKDEDLYSSDYRWSELEFCKLNGTANPSASNIGASRFRVLCELSNIRLKTFSEIAPLKLQKIRKLPDKPV